MKWLRDTAELARQTALMQMRSKMGWLLFGGALVLTAFFTFAPADVARTPGDQLFGLVTYVIWMTFGLPFAALFYSTNAVHGDIEDRTATYLFLRPVARSSLLVGKWLGAAFVAWAVIVVCFCTMFLGFALPDRNWRGGFDPDPGMLPSFIGAAGLAALAYTALGCALSALMKRPLLAGIVFLVAWEGAVAQLAPRAQARDLTVSDPLRRFLTAAQSPREEYRELLQGPFRAAGESADPIWAMTRFALVLLAVAVFVYRRREYDSRPAE
jgi:hypothetical protein